MIKALRAFRRAPGMTQDEFLRRWETHAQLVLAVPGLRGYSQSPRAGRDAQSSAPFDGFSSMWFDDVGAAADAAASPEGQAARADSSAFIAADGVQAVHTVEHVLRDMPVGAQAVKLVFFFHRRVGLAPEVFRRHWVEVHAPLVMQYIEPLRRYVQNHAVDAAYAEGRAPDFDGLAECYLDDLATLEATEESPEHDLVRSDEPNFIDVNQVMHLVTSERVHLPPRD